MDWSQPTVIIATIALLVSITSLGWNIFAKISENKSLLDFTVTIVRYGGKETDTTCTVSVTNIGQKPVTIRRIEIQEKKENKIKFFHTIYRDYNKDIENKPLNSGEWRHIVLKEHKQYPFWDEAISKYKLLRLTIIDSKNKKYRTKWFRQSFHR